MFQHNWEVNSSKTEQAGYLLDGNLITKWGIISPERQHDTLLWAEIQLDKTGRILAVVQAVSQCGPLFYPQQMEPLQGQGHSLMLWEVRSAGSAGVAALTNEHPNANYHPPEPGK